MQKEQASPLILKWLMSLQHTILKSIKGIASPPLPNSIYGSVT